MIVYEKYFEKQEFFGTDDKIKPTCLCVTVKRFNLINHFYTITRITLREVKTIFLIVYLMLNV